MPTYTQCNKDEATHLYNTDSAAPTHIVTYHDNKPVGIEELQ